MSLDIDIGFLEKPKGLEGLLRKNRYELVNKDGYEVYEKIGKTWPTLYYFGDFVPDPTGNIDWEEMGFKVVSELNINYPYNDADSFEEAEKLVKIIAKKFNCVVYYPSSEDYFISEDFKQV